MSHLERASDLLTVAAESATDQIHVAGLRRLAVGVALLRAPLEKIAARLSGEKEQAACQRPG